MVVPRGTPDKHTRLDPDSLNKRAKDSPSKPKEATIDRRGNNHVPHPADAHEACPPTTSKPSHSYLQPKQLTTTKATSAKEATIDRRSDNRVPHPPAPGLLRSSIAFTTSFLARDLSSILRRSDQAAGSPLGARQSATRPMPPSLATSLWPPPPQFLLEHLLNLFEAEAVGALGIFVADPQGLPCLRLVHGLRKYPGPLAQHSPNKNKAFEYLDDIEGEAGELVLVDLAMLSPTIASRVLTLDHHLAELEAHPGRLSIPAIPEGTGHSKLIRAHKAFFIPFDQALGVLHPQLNRVGLMESCTPLFNTLRLAGTTATEPGVNPKLLQPGPSFRSETGLTNYMKHKVMYRDLPELERPWDTPGDPALTAAVTALTDHQLKLSENMDHKRSQSVRTTWGPLYTQRLLLLCGLGSKDQA
eukprot:jgi/Psemu1/57767/gm1.57767_g